MTEDQAKTKIRKFIFAKFPLAKKQNLKDGDPLLESGILDSLGVLDLVHFAEQEFSIHIVDEELTPENFQTVDCIADFVLSKKA
jgi:acyl carrier protein